MITCGTPRHAAVRPKRSDTAAGINEMADGGIAYMLDHRLDLRVPAPGELDMDKGLLLVDDQRAGGKREDICPDIAPGKEFIDPRNGFQVGACNPRHEIPGLYNTPHFRYIPHQCVQRSSG